MKTKTIDESVENYVIGTVQGAYRTKRNWMKKKFDEDSAIKKTLDWAYAQIEAGIGETFSLKDAEAGFREMSEIANILAEACRQANNNLK